MQRSRRATRVTSHVTNDRDTGNGSLDCVVDTVLTISMISRFLTTLMTRICIRVKRASAFQIRGTLGSRIVTGKIGIDSTRTMYYSATHAKAATQTRQSPLTLNVISVVPSSRMVINVTRHLSSASLMIRTIFINLQRVKAMTTLRALPTRLFGRHLIIRTTENLVVQGFNITGLGVGVTLINGSLYINANLQRRNGRVMRLVHYFGMRFINLRLRAINVLRNFSNLSTRRGHLRLNVLLTRMIKIINNYRKSTNLPYRLSRLKRRGIVLFRPIVLRFGMMVTLAGRITVPRNEYLDTLMVTKRSHLQSLAHRTNERTSRTFIMLLRRLLVRAQLKMRTLSGNNEGRFNGIFVTHLILTRRSRVVITVSLIRLVGTNTNNRVSLATSSKLSAYLFNYLMGLRATMRRAIINTNGNDLATLFRPVRRLIGTTNAIRRAMFYVSVRISRISSLLVTLAKFSRFISSFSTFSSGHLHESSTDTSDFFVQYRDPSLLANKSGRTRETIESGSKFSVHVTTTYYGASNDISDTPYSYGGQVTQII